MISVVSVDFRVPCLGSVHRVPDLGMVVTSYHLSRSQLCAQGSCKDSPKEGEEEGGKEKRKEEMIFIFPKYKGQWQECSLMC